jgi:hypothetical protein
VREDKPVSLSVSIPTDVRDEPDDPESADLAIAKDSSKERRRGSTATVRVVRGGGGGRNAGSCAIYLVICHRR